MNLNLRKMIVWAMLVLAFQAERSAAAEPVLLVGNSFTGYTYDQITFRQLFRDRFIGGWNLDQHFNDSLTRSMVCNGRTFVVLQDFSTRAANSALFQFDMNEMIPFVRSCGAVPALFMTWETNFINYNTIRNAYDQAGATHNAQVIPIGTVWNRIRASSESMYQSFLQTDGKHPTIRGAKINAASLLRAFCYTCYQSFNWSGFTPAEVTFVKGIIGQHIVTVLVPPPPPPSPPPSPPSPPEEEESFTALPAILLLLLE